jgi:hypothetical protein
MGFIKATAIGVTLTVLTAVGSPVWAVNVEEFVEAPAEVVVQAKPPCGGAKVKYAQALGDEYRRKGDFRMAAECYRVAGDHNRADRMLAQVFAGSGEGASRKASATIDSARAQATQLREALKGKPAARRS